MIRGGYEQCYILGCDALGSSRSSPTFRRNVVSQSSGFKSKPSGEGLVSDARRLLAWLTLQTWRWRQYVLQKVGKLLPNCTMSDPRNTILHVHCCDNIKVITTEVSFAFGFHSNYKPQPQPCLHKLNVEWENGFMISGFWSLVTEIGLVRDLH
jgi:hypothetical protein